MIDTKLVMRYALRETMGLVMMGLALFWSAGRLDWWAGWAAIGLMLAWSVGIAVAILRINPALLAERLGPRKGAKVWDTTIMSLMGLLQLARYILAGLDQRNEWTGGFTMEAQLIALGVCVVGHALFLWAVASNAYFSQIVRIQSERGHEVAVGGPYRFVRHPGYLGAILFELGVAVLLASWIAVWISVVTTALLILRTALEDRTLRTELARYQDYAEQVPFRLVPGVW